MNVEAHIKTEKPIPLKSRTIIHLSLVQNKINEKLAIPPVSRQLKGPNILESECIKSDVDGIYCRKMKGFNHSCPSVFISAFSVQSMSDFSNWILTENSFNYCEKLGHAIIEGLENYLNSKNIKN